VCEIDPVWILRAPEGNDDRLTILGGNKFLM
jgi:hypothetical protein